MMPGVGMADQLEYAKGYIATFLPARGRNFIPVHNIVSLNENRYL